MATTLARPASSLHEEGGGRSLGLLVLVFSAGAATLAAEIAAARLLAPYFGSSTFIWANTIAIVLLALAVGSWFGGRMADRHPSERRLREVVVGACVLLAVVPFAAGPILSVAAEAFKAIDAGGFIASLIGILLLCALPLTLLGAVAPWAIRLAAPDVASTGAATGRIYALSTIGGLLGLFAATLVLVPALGTQRTFVVSAAVLAVIAAAGLSWRWLAAPALLAAALAIPAGVTKAGSGDERVVYEEETPYQYVRVVEEDGDRLLELNEGRAVHSVYRPDTVLTDGVWDGYLVAPLTRPSGPPRSMAMLGNADGTVSRSYERFFPGTKIDGVEIDGALSDLGRRLFAMDNPNLRVFDADARPFLRRTKSRYDVITIDAYRQPYIPFYLTTREFFSLARSRLNRGGAVVVNVGHPPGDDRLEKALSATLGSVFPNVVRYPIKSANTLLVASFAPLNAGNVDRAARNLPPALRPVAFDAAARLRAPLAGGTVFTDDKAPVEWLIDASIAEYAAR